ncbi:hypothetical protein PAPHI01_2548 [Pancytospora philotis]|nr:hypothetical protein PAPHI01_2548 [Pancytospora philotis]
MDGRSDKSESETQDDMNFGSGANGCMGNFMQGYGQDLSSQYMDGQFAVKADPQDALINPKQLYWIRRRRMRREMLDSLMVIQNSNYLHESRHRHAMKRLRAPSGRFLTKAEAEKARRQADFAGN